MKKQPDNKPQLATGQGKLPRDIQAALNKVLAYAEKIRPEQPAAGEIAEQARKEREQKVDGVYSELVARAEYLSQQSELLYMLDAHQIDLPESLDGIFAEMKDKSNEIQHLARQLSDILTGRGTPKSNEE